MYNRQSYPPRRPPIQNMAVKPNNKQPACINCGQGFMFMFRDIANNGTKCPLLLNCGHSICENCVRLSLRGEDQSITCNICQKVSTPSSKVESIDSLRQEFPLNIYLVGQITVRNSRSRLEDNMISFGNQKKSSGSTNDTQIALCGECGTVPTGYLCRQCDVAYCDGCFIKIHQSAKSLQKHEKVPMSKCQLNGDSVYCKDHPGQKLEFFCHNCDTSICSHCFICNHKSHDLTTLKEKNSLLVSRLTEAHEEARNMLKRLHFTQKKVFNSTKQGPVDEQAKNVERAVSSHFAFLHGFLQLREEQLLKEIKDAQNITETSLEDVAKELEASIKEVEEALSLGTTVLNPNNLGSYDLSSTLEKLESVCHLPCHLVMSEDQDETTSYSFTAAHITTILTDHCNLTVPSGKKWYLRANDELPEDFVIEEIKPEATTFKKPVLPPRPLQQPPDFGSGMSTASTDSLSETKTVNTVLPLKAGSVEQVTVCHLLSPSDFYVHRKSSNKDLASYSQMFAKCSYVRHKSPEAVIVGFLYFVKFIDNKWYRGRVLDKLDEDRVEIYYIDYGNTQKTSIKELRPIPEKFISLPPLAVHCSLCHCVPAGNEWSPEAINLMANVTSNVEVTMHVFRLSPTDVYEVDLTRVDCGLLSMRDALIFLELAKMTDMSYRVPNVKKDFYVDLNIKPGQNFTSLITSVKSPSEFYVKKADKSVEYIIQFFNDMDKFYKQEDSEKLVVYTPSIGLPVAALYSSDNTWYRAQVIDLPGNRQVEVFYVDFGNSEILDWDKLRYLQDRFLRMSCQALYCSLCDVLPKDSSQWSAEATAWLTEFTQGKPLQINIVVADITQCKVVLYEQQPHSDICINALLVKEGYAVSVGPNSSIVDFPRVKVSSLYQNKNILCEATNVLPRPAQPSKAPIKTKKTINTNKNRNHQKKMPAKPSAADSDPVESDATSCDKESTIEDESANPLRIPIKILNVITPSLFYVSLSSQENEIQKLSKEMAAYYSAVTKHNSSWAENSKCALMRLSDKKWYRGVIVDISPESQAKVLLKDIAAIEVVDIGQLMPLNEKFLTIRDGAIKCHLSGILAPGGQGVWPAISTEVFIEETQAYAKLFMSKMGEIVNESLPVELFVKVVTVGGALEPTMTEWKTINKILVERGFALPDRNKGEEVNTTSEYLKSLESNTNCISMEELVSDWIKNTRKDIAKSLNQPTENDGAASKSTSANTSTTPMDEAPLPANVPPQIPELMITEWLPAEPFQSLQFIAVPTYVDYDCNIYLQDTEHCKDTLTIIRDGLLSKYKNSRPMPHDLFWFPGQICVAQYFFDKLWYRAVVLTVKEDTSIDVQFVDYGNIENCKASQLRKTIAMGHIPVQCHRCSTPGIIPISPDGKWPVDTLDFIHGSIVEKSCYVELKKSDSSNCTYSVLSLKTPGNLDLFNLLMSMQYATMFIDCDQVCVNEETHSQEEDESEEKKLDKMSWNEIVQYDKMKEEMSYKPATIPNIKECLVDVTSVTSPIDCVVQLVGNETEELQKSKQEFENLIDEMQEDAENQPLLDKPEKGQICCACFTADNMWYRAKIIEVLNNNTVKVQYVDFGNMEILSLDRVRTMKREWLELPVQGICVRFWGVQKPPTIDLQKVSNYYQDCLINRENPFTMKIMNRLGVLSVQLYDEKGVLAYQPLLDEKFLLNSLMPKAFSKILNVH